MKERMKFKDLNNSDKKKFWIVVGVVLGLIAFLMLFRPLYYTGVLVVENDEGESVRIQISDLYTIRGIDFQNLRTNVEVYGNADLEHVIRLMERFYDRHREDRGRNLLKVFYVDQVIRFSQLQSMDYVRLIFHAADGARVVIEPQQHRDFLILLALERDRRDLSLRLIMPEDNFSQRWLKNVVRIEVISDRTQLLSSK